MKVWIVDDNFTNCYVLKEMLLSQTYIEELMTYTLPQKILDELVKSDKKPDIILTDIMMPYMDGYTLSKDIKKKFPDIRVIGITALPRSRELLNQVKTCGMEDVIFKPYDMKILVDYLQLKN